MSVFKNVLFVLGFGADDAEYDDDYLAEESSSEESVEDDRRRETDKPRGPASYQRFGDGRPAITPRGTFGAPQNPTDRPSAVGAVRPLRSVPAADGEEVEESERLASNRVSTMEGAVMRPVSSRSSKPRALNPQSFGDAKVIADELKKSVPVIMNLRGLDRDLGRRLIDFASGACYSLSGKMEKIAPQVFLLIPKSVEISDDDRRRIDERGFDRD